MARNQNQAQSADRAKVRIFYGEADGSSQSIQDLVRLLGQVVRPSQPQMQYGQNGAIPAPPLAKQPDPAEDHPLFNDLEPSDENVGSEAEPFEANEGQRRRRGDGPKVARNAGIQLVSGLDFIQEGKQSLKDFFAEKSPKKDMEQIVVFAYYMQEVMELRGFSPGHVLSAYKHIGNLKIPLDLKATLRNMKKQKGWLTFTEFEHMRIDTEGENFVKTGLGREKAKAK